MRIVVGKHNPARELRPREPARGAERKRQRHAARPLLHHRPEVDRRPVDPRRRSGFQPAERKAQPRQRSREPERRRLAEPPLGAHLIATERLAAEKRPGRQHHVRRPKRPPVAQHHPGNRRAVEEQILGHAGHHGQIGRRGQYGARRIHVAGLVGEHAQRPHRRPLRLVEEASVERGRVRDARHLAAERIDFAHELTLRTPADRRVAGKRADPLRIAGHQQRFRAEARGG